MRVMQLAPIINFWNRSEERTGSPFSKSPLWMILTAELVNLNIAEGDEILSIGMLQMKPPKEIISILPQKCKRTTSFLFLVVILILRNTYCLDF